MAKRPRRSHTAVFKAKVALEAVKEERTVIEIADITGVHPNLVTKWKKQLQERASDAFLRRRERRKTAPAPRSSAPRSASW